MNPPTPASKPPGNDSQVFIDQARWLMEWHNKRSDAITARAVSLLGFVGVVLALLFQAANLTVHLNHWTKPLVYVAILCLLLGGLASLGAIRVRPMRVLGVDQMQHWWDQHRQEPIEGTMAPKFAEAYLNSLGKVRGGSAVGDAKEDADARVAWLKAAVASTAAGLISLSVLLLTILDQTWKGK